MNKRSDYMNDDANLMTYVEDYDDVVASCIHGILCWDSGPLLASNPMCGWSDYVVLPCGGLMTQCSSHD